MIKAQVLPYLVRIFSLRLMHTAFKAIQSFLNFKPHFALDQNVVVTGIGVVSPLGHSLSEFWSRLIAGDTGIDHIKRFDVSSFPCKIAAELPVVNFRDHLSRTQIGYYPRATQLMCVAFDLAKRDSGITNFDANRTDVLIGTSSNAFEYIDKEVMQNKVTEYGGFDPLGISKLNFNCSAAAIAARENLGGYAGTISAACASGVSALGLGIERIRFGMTDTVIVGATDVGVTRFLLNLFCSAKFVSFDTDPKTAVKPFDIEHTRSVLGDGACVFILKRESEARKSKLKMYGRLLSYAQSFENMNGLFKVDASGVKWANTMLRAIEGVPGDIDYVNAHAPGDEHIDNVELKALEIAFQGRKVPYVSSIKGAIGSPFGVAGAFQVVSTLLTLQTGIIPPSRGLKNPTGNNNIKLVADQALKVPVKRALINSRGLGGVNSSIICERLEE